MTGWRIFRSAIVAAILAALCIRYDVFGAVISLFVTLLAIAVLPRPSRKPASPAQPTLSEFRPWFVGTAWFAAFTAILAPWAWFPGVPIALLILSPILGMMVLAIESGLGEVQAGLGRKSSSDVPK